MNKALPLIEDAACVVLAGGESRRFGRDKSTATLMEQTLTERVVESLLPIFPSLFVGVRTLPHPLEERIKSPFIEDVLAIRGPISGIYTAMKRVDRQWLFVVACDMPLVRRELVAYLAERREGFHVVLPVVGGRPQTLCAFYRVKPLVAYMEDYIDKGERSLKKFLHSYDINICCIGEEELSTVDPELTTFLDIDTAQDVAAVEKILREESRG